MYFRILEDNLKPIQDIILQELCDQDTRLSILLDLAKTQQINLQLIYIIIEIRQNLKICLTKS